MTVAVPVCRADGKERAMTVLTVETRCALIRAADEDARRAFYTALCDGASYADAYVAGSNVFRAAMAPLWVRGS